MKVYDSTTNCEHAAKLIQNADGLPILICGHDSRLVFHIDLISGRLQIVDASEDEKRELRAAGYPLEKKMAFRNTDGKTKMTFRHTITNQRFIAELKVNPRWPGHNNSETELVLITDKGEEVSKKCTTIVLTNGTPCQRAQLTMNNYHFLLST